MKTILILAILAVETITCTATDVRVRNESAADFKDVYVSGKKYGDIKQGETTEYQQNIRAWVNATASLISGGKAFKIQRIDNVGEEVLGEGKFTYVIKIKEGDLIIRAERDSK